MDRVKTIQFIDGELILIDQTLLPNEIRYNTYTDIEGVYQSIQTMVVRGAPAIGVTAGYGMAIAANNIENDTYSEFITQLVDKGSYLAKARPTAVNLTWAIDRMITKAKSFHDKSVDTIKNLLIQEAVKIHREDEEINRCIGENLLSLLKDGDTVLTHCNAGELATSKYGTALSPFYLAKEKGMNIKVYADETRPRLQGSRLTAFELMQGDVDVTIITDNTAAVVMSQGKIDAVIVGCDRVAKNGDVANKIGTFGVSILAKYHNIPFYVATPSPTIDYECAKGADIPIEERAKEEVTCRFGQWTAPKDAKVYCPAFDVTPASNITAIVTEQGVVYPPFEENLDKLDR